MLFVGYIITRAVIDPSLAPNEELPPAQRRVGALARRFSIHVLPLVLIFAIVVGAMTGGFATPTEAAALGAAATIAGGDLLSRADWREPDEGAHRHGRGVGHDPVHHPRRDDLLAGA